MLPQLSRPPWQGAHLSLFFFQSRILLKLSLNQETEQKADRVFAWLCHARSAAPHQEQVPGPDADWGATSCDRGTSCLQAWALLCLAGSTECPAHVLCLLPETGPRVSLEFRVAALLFLSGQTSSLSVLTMCTVAALPSPPCVPSALFPLPLCEMPCGCHCHHPCRLCPFSPALRTKPGREEWAPLNILME